MKKIGVFIALIGAVLLGSLFMENTVSAAEYGYLEYSVDSSTGEATITGCDTTISGALEIPAMIDTYPVTGINHQAFMDCVALTSVTIPEGVITIGASAFAGCSQLTEIFLPKSVNSIDIGAFSWCGKLKNIYIESGNPRYYFKDYCLIDGTGKMIIWGCAQSAIPADGSVDTIGHAAFAGCDELTSFVIPEGIIYIDSSAFSDCTGLKKITLPEGLQTIGNYAFSSCTHLESILFPTSVWRLGNYVFSKCTNLMSIKWLDPNSNMWLGDCVFEYCVSLQTITVPNFSCYHDSESESGMSLFYGCTSLYKVVYNAEVIKRSTFSGCTALREIELPNVYSIQYSAFNGCTSLEKIQFPNRVSIFPYAFCGCDGLTELVIPENSSIGEGGFWGCEGLKSVTLLSGTTLGDAVFLGCNIEQITISDGVITGGYCFGVPFADCSIKKVRVYSVEQKTLFVSWYSGTADIVCLCEGAHMYTDSNDISCDVCEFVGPRMKQAFAVLTESINMHFDVLCDVDTINKGKPEMIITFNGTEFTASYEVLENGWRFSFPDILPQEMCLALSAKLYVDGVFVDELSNYSVQTYCMNVLKRLPEDSTMDDQQKAAMQNLIVSLLNYGTEVQRYFGQNEDHYANNELPTVFGDEIPDVTQAMQNAQRVTSVDNNGTTYWKSATLGMYEVPQLRFTLYTEDVNTVSITVNGVHVNLSELRKANEYLYYLYVPVSADSFGESFTICATSFGSSSSVIYSMNSYIRYVADNETKAGEDVVALAQALYNYGCAAYTYALLK